MLFLWVMFYMFVDIIIGCIISIGGFIGGCFGWLFGGKYCCSLYIGMFLMIWDGDGILLVFRFLSCRIFRLFCVVVIRCLIGCVIIEKLRFIIVFEGFLISLNCWVFFWIILVCIVI